MNDKLAIHGFTNWNDPLTIRASYIISGDTCSGSVDTFIQSDYSYLSSSHLLSAVRYWIYLSC